MIVIGVASDHGHGHSADRERMIMGFWDWAATDNNLVGVVIVACIAAVAIVFIVRNY